MERVTPEAKRFESQEQDSRSGNAPLPEPALTLIAALASYLGSSRNKGEIRQAIRTWRYDVANAGLQPERLLIEFKHILLGLKPAQQSLDLDQRLADRREMIAMCIEEYYR